MAAEIIMYSLMAHAVWMQKDMLVVSIPFASVKHRALMVPASGITRFPSTGQEYNRITIASIRRELLTVHRVTVPRAIAALKEVVIMLQVAAMETVFRNKVAGITASKEEAITITATIYLNREV